MKRNGKKLSRTSNIESDNSQNGGLEDYYYCSLHGLNFITSGSYMATVRPWQTQPQPGLKKFGPKIFFSEKMVPKICSKKFGPPKICRKKKLS